MIRAFSDISMENNGHWPAIISVINRQQGSYSTSTNAQLATASEKLANQAEKLQAIDGKLVNIERDLSVHLTPDEQLLAENAALEKQLMELMEKLETKKSEADAHLRKLETRLKELSLASSDRMERIKQLNSRLVEIETKSNDSFFGSTRAPTEAGDDDDGIVDLDSLELDKI